MNIITEQNAALIQREYEKNIRKYFPIHSPARCTMLTKELGRLSILTLAKKYQNKTVNENILREVLCSIIAFCLIWLGKMDKKKVAVVVDKESVEIENN